jgi:hypothetical protein
MSEAQKNINSRRDGKGVFKSDAPTAQNAQVDLESIIAEMYLFNRGYLPLGQMP